VEIEGLQRQFAAIGARARVEILPASDRLWQPRWRSQTPVPRCLLDVRSERREETFLVTVRQDGVDELALSVLDVQPQWRHLLLLVRDPRAAAEERKNRFVCGHDERHWFVAMVPKAQGVVTVEDALEQLKPVAVVASQRAKGVRVRHWHDRHNAGYIRQGEWFFVPRPDFQPANPWLVLHNEPIARSGGTRHWVETLYRYGGTTVYVTPRYPQGLTPEEYSDLLVKTPKARTWNWQVMRRGAQVYAMGKIRHPDHKTIWLPFWHQVFMSAETRSGGVVFLD
jgi:hypothetical protein